MTHKKIVGLVGFLAAFAVQAPFCAAKGKRHQGEARDWSQALVEQTEAPSGNLLDQLLYAHTPQDEGLESLLRKTGRTIEQVKNRSFDREQDLYQQAREKVIHMRRDADEQTKQIFDQLEEDVSCVHRQTMDASQEVRQETVKTILTLIERAEQEALALKRKHRAQLAQQALEKQEARRGAKRLTKSHKKNLEIQWNRVTDYIESIILDGESEKERKDFAQRFAQQHRWFAATLASAVSSNDSSYKALLAKKHALDQLAAAQQRADSLITGFVTASAVAPGFIERVRLEVLYELYRLVDQSSATGATMPSEQIDAIVRKQVSRVTGLSLAYTGKELRDGVKLKAEAPTIPLRGQLARKAERVQACHRDLEDARRQALEFNQQLIATEERFKRCMELLREAKGQQQKDQAELQNLKNQLGQLSEKLPELQKQLTHMRHEYGAQVKSYVGQIKRLQDSLDTTSSTARSFMEIQDAQAQRERSELRGRLVRMAQEKEAKSQDYVQQLLQMQTKHGQQMASQREQDQQLLMQMVNQQNTTQSAWQNRIQELDRSLAQAQKELSDLHARFATAQQQHSQELQSHRQAADQAQAQLKDQLHSVALQAEQRASSLALQHQESVAKQAQLVQQIDQVAAKAIAQSKELAEQKEKTGDLSSRLKVADELLAHATQTYREALLPRDKGNTKTEAALQKEQQNRDYETLEAELAAWPMYPGK